MELGVGEMCCENSQKKKRLEHCQRTNKSFGSGALSGKMLLVRIVENIRIDDYFRTG